MNQQLKNQLTSLKKASYQLHLCSTEERNQALELIKQTLLDNSSAILKANKKDLDKMNENDSLYDRLLLDELRIKGICIELQNVIDLNDPLNKALEKSEGPSGIKLKKISVPLGCIGIIYEARPNVTVDVTSLCLKSGNAVLLRGSSSAYESNSVIVNLIQSALEKSHLPKDSVQLMEPDRELTKEMLQANEYLDLIIPRGSAKLIQYVRENASVPTIETGASVVHTFVDKSANIEMACDIIINEKTRRPSVCNALDTVLVHEDIMSDFVPALAEKMKDSGVLIHADMGCHQLLHGSYDDAKLMSDAEDHFNTEFLGLEMNIAVVSDFNTAIEHIRKYSLKHSESIITEDPLHAERFQKEVDAACVYVNTSTAFSDGAQFGLGSEIGISTQKLHARGPMGLEELTSYKWLINSDGLTRA
ncbi:MAG: glutamate-5-semialdehyde dehydrogenase [Candidatus Gracilibacteria bacterium]|nr:glutamate-5-semialdehyde dehydrogenase [Candidatus Gracilibacteria bacterium]